jgi:hypothetical protein
MKASHRPAAFRKSMKNGNCPKRRQRRLGIPFDMHRAGETVEADAFGGPLFLRPSRPAATPKADRQSRVVDYCHAWQRFYEGERRPGIDYPWSIALTEENQDDTT